MKITAKWIVWFAITALYVAAVGGFACFYLFNSTFDQKLQSEMMDLVRSNAPFLVTHVAQMPNTDASTAEADRLMQIMHNDDRIADITYLNPNATIRWYKDGAYLGKSYEEAYAMSIFPTGAVYQAFTKQNVKINKFGGGNYYDVAVPLKGAKGVLAGVLEIQVSRVGTKAQISSAMLRYAGGAVVVLLIMGGVLYLFMYFKVVAPLKELVGAVRSVSLKEMHLNYPSRSDEIGDAARGINELFVKVRSEMKAFAGSLKKKKDVETVWWQALLAVSVSRGARALVVDQDNNIMFTNFDISFARPHGGAIHLLDVFDGNQSALIETVGKATDAAGTVFKTTADFGGKKVEIRAVKLPGERGEATRTMIIMEPVK